MSRRLILYIVICSSVLTLILTGIQLYRSYHADLDLIDTEFERIEKVHVEPVAEDLWVGDKENLENIVRGISNLRDLSYVAVIEQGVVQISIGELGEGMHKSRSFPLLHEHRGEPVEFGRLEAAFDLDAVNRRLLDRTLEILISNAIKTALVVVFMVLIFYRLVTRHLTQIAGFVRDIDEDKLDQKLQLYRPPNADGERDELDRVTEAINRHLRESRELLNERKRSEISLRDSEARFRDFAESSSDWFWEMDANLEFIYISSRFFDMSGFEPEDVYGNLRRGLADNRAEDFDSEKWKQHFAAIEQRKPFRNFGYQIRCKNGKSLSVMINGTPVHADNGDFLGYRGTGTDVTEQYEMQTQLTYQARHDALTGLLNRYEFEQRVNRLLETVREDHTEHAMCFIDLDQFKIVNDTCGHTAGDALLHQLGKLLQETVRSRDTLTRLGGDEFGVLIEHCPFNKAKRVAETILNAIQNYSFFWGGETFHIGASIGLVAITESTLSFTELFKQADTACYLAKDMGRNRIHAYHPDDSELADRQGEMQWATRISQALDEDRFSLFAQPIISLDGSESIHYELLLRMLDGDGNLIPPGAFLPAAERYNLIERLDCWVFDRACRYFREHRDFFERVDFISINLSGNSLTNNNFLDTIVSSLKDPGIPSARICFEITETVAVYNLESAVKFINVLRKLGCRFALDDFGSGLSSFAYLKNLPVDFLKIDGMFVKDIENDPIDRAMVNSINDMGKVMKMQTIAEFVENERIRDMLMEIGVDYGQGYALGKPRSLDELIEKQNKSRLSLVDTSPRRVADS